MKYIFFILLFCSVALQSSAQTCGGNTYITNNYFYNSSGVPVADTSNFQNNKIENDEELRGWDYVPGKHGSFDSDNKSDDKYDDMYYDPGFNNSNSTNVTNIKKQVINLGASAPSNPIVVYPYYNPNYGYRYYNPYYFQNGNWYYTNYHPGATITINGARFSARATISFGNTNGYNNWYNTNQNWCATGWNPWMF